MLQELPDVAMYSTTQLLLTSDGAIALFTDTTSRVGVKYYIDSSDAPWLQYGTGDDDELYGAGPRNQFFESGGSDQVTGGGSSNAAIYAEARTDYAISRNGNGQIELEKPGGGTDTLDGIDQLIFMDRAYNLTIGGKAQLIEPDALNSLVDLYVAYFNRVPEAGGLGYWIDQYLGGKPLSVIAAEFYAAGIQFSDVTGYTADMPLSDFIMVLHANVLGRSGSSAPPQEDIDYWLDQLNTNAVTREGMVARFLSDARQFYDDPNVGWVPRLLDQKVELGKLHAVTYGLDYNDQQTSIETTVALAAAVTPTGYDAAVAIVGLSADDYLIT